MAPKLRRLRKMSAGPGIRSKPTPGPAEPPPPEAEQPTISELLPQGIHESLDRGMHYEELIHRFQAMVLQIMEGRIRRQREQRIQAAAAGVRWTPERLRAEQDRLVNARLSADGQLDPDKTETELDGTDEDEEDAAE